MTSEPDLFDDLPPPSRSEAPELDEAKPETWEIADDIYTIVDEIREDDGNYNGSWNNPLLSTRRCMEMIEAYVRERINEDRLTEARPSRSETPDANDDILNRIIFDAQSWLTRSTDGEHDEVVPAYSDAEIKRRLIAWARPSREEEMREQIERIKHDCENALRSSTHHKCDYLSLIQSINDRLARAALAQGGVQERERGST